MSEIKIPTRECPHCFAGREPVDGHTVEELKAEALERFRTSPRTAEMDARAERKRAEMAVVKAGRG